MIEKDTRFGKLVTTGNFESRRGPNGKTYRYYECRCDCGNVVWTRGSGLKNGHCKSCGCKLRNREWKNKHDMSNTRLYSIWLAMKNRCYKKNSNSYKNYGGRGITVCDEWLGKMGSANFMKWALDNGYSENLTIDRIDNDGIYCPQNCRWITVSEQARNKRNTVKYLYNGEYLVKTDIAKMLGVGVNTFSYWQKKIGFDNAVKKYLKTEE